MIWNHVYVVLRYWIIIVVVFIIVVVVVIAADTIFHRIEITGFIFVETCTGIISTYGIIKIV